MNILSKFSCPIGAFLVLSLVAPVTVTADIDWGGGATRFLGEDGVELTSETGCAVLVAVSAGELIDFNDFIPQQPQDLVSIGSVLREGANVNRIVASSCFFYSGYLLYSAIPDLSVDELAERGVQEGDRLHLVVWDRNTFLDGMPTDNSFYTVQALYEAGAADSPAYASLSPDSAYAQVIYPDSEHEVDQTLSAARKAGHNTVQDFLAWLAAQPDAGSLTDENDPYVFDSDGDGRSYFEEYAFRSRPRLDANALTGDKVSSAQLSSDSTKVDSLPGFVVELRASDTSLTYTAHASDDLSVWQTSEIYFDQGAWRSAVPEFNITTTEYLGEGVWAVAMRYQSPQTDSRCFYKMSVDEVAP